MESKILTELTELKDKFTIIKETINELQSTAQKVIDTVGNDYEYTDEEKKIQAETEDMVEEIYEFINSIYSY